MSVFVIEADAEQAADPVVFTLADCRATDNLFERALVNKGWAIMPPIRSKSGRCWRHRESPNRSNARRRIANFVLSDEGQYRLNVVLAAGIRCAAP